MTRQPPTSPLFPYTTLFRSIDDAVADVVADRMSVIADRAAGAGVETDDAARLELFLVALVAAVAEVERRVDRKSTRLNSSHSQISYAVFCLKKKTRYRAQVR